MVLVLANPTLYRGSGWSDADGGGGGSGGDGKAWCCATTATNSAGLKLLAFHLRYAIICCWVTGRAKDMLQRGHQDTDTVIIKPSSERVEWD